MYLKRLVVNSLEYNLWANQQFAEWLLGKDENLLLQEVPSSFSSILQTVNHIRVTQEYWWSVVGEIRNFAPTHVEPELSGFAVFARLIANSQELLNYVKSLSEEELQTTRFIQNKLFECHLSVFEYTQQLAIHGTYHRGQVVTIARNVGITDAPLTDYVFWRGVVCDYFI